MTRGPAALIAAACLAPFTLVACGGGDGGVETAAGGESQLEIGYTFNPDAGEIGGQVAIDRVERTTDIDIVPRELGDSEGAISALQRGDIDLASEGVSDAINAASGGANVVAIMADEMRPEWLLAARPEIKRLGQLKGKRIATDPPGENTAALVDLSLERAGLEKDDVELSTIGESTQRAAALASGRIDATPLEFADFERLRGEGGLDLNILSTLQDLSPVKPRTAFLVRRDFAAKHRALLQELVNGLVDGYAFLYTPDGRRAWIEKARESALKDDPAALGPAAYSFYRDLGYWPRGKPSTKADYDRSVEFWLESEQIEKTVRFDEVWDLSLWRRAAAR